ncbi:MAG: hypothetical protein ACR2O6_12030 [Ilumatobacteraceae bacterium]
MRWTPLLLVGALAVGACGSASEEAGPVGDEDVATAPGGSTTVATDPAPGSVTGLGEAATATMGQLGDDDVATAAVFLAFDGGYQLTQIVDAGPAGRLLVNGEIVADDGSPVAPDGEPTALIIDDVTAEYQVAGFRAIPQRPLSGLMVRFQEATEPPGKEQIYQRLFLLLALMQQGYTLEQIMTALFAFGGLNDELELTDENSTVVEPADDAIESLELTDEDYERALATTSTAPPTTEPKSEEELLHDQLVDVALGVYSITPDLGVHLQGLGDVISVVPPVGEFVVAEDGTISGSFVYTIVQGVDDARLTSKWDRTLVEAELTLLDDGLTFTAPMDLLITWNESDTQPYVENVTGILDVDLGQLVVTGFTELDSVRFARA